jgi:hypothetical protein
LKKFGKGLRMGLSLRPSMGDKFLKGIELFSENNSKKYQKNLVYNKISITFAPALRDKY